MRWTNPGPVKAKTLMQSILQRILESDSVGLDWYGFVLVGELYRGPHPSDPFVLTEG